MFNYENKLHQYQQSEKSPVISKHWTSENSKRCDVENPDSG